jgi:hypothetical protein
MDRIDPAVFDALTRAVDAGLPIDAARVRTWIEKALPANALPVAKAEGAITINAGQARLSNLILRTQVADLSASGSLDLSEGVIDARLTLSGPQGTGGVANARPEIAIALKGPIAAPKRSIDVAALSTWLALRAVEQQSKKLEALEGRAASPNAAPREAAVEPSKAPADPPPPPPKIRIEQAPPKARPEPPPSQNAPAVSRPVPPAAQVETSPAKPAVPRPPASPLPASPPTTQKPPPRPAEQARPLPPPTNILPFFAPRT